MLDAEWQVASEFVKVFSTPLLIALVEMMRRGLARLRTIEQQLIAQNGRVGRLETRMADQERLCDHLHPTGLQGPRLP